MPKFNALGAALDDKRIVLGGLAVVVLGAILIGNTCSGSHRGHTPARSLESPNQQMPKGPSDHDGAESVAAPKRTQRQDDTPSYQPPVTPKPPSQRADPVPTGVSARVVPKRGGQAPYRDSPGFDSNIVGYLGTATAVELGARRVTTGKNTPDVWYQVTLSGQTTPVGWMHEEILMKLGP